MGWWTASCTPSRLGRLVTFEKLPMKSVHAARPKSFARLGLHHPPTRRARRASGGRRAGSPLAATVAGFSLRSLLALLGLAASAGDGLAADFGAPPGGLAPSDNAGSDSSAPGASTHGEDFTGLNLAELMQVEVPMVYGASKHEQKITEAPSNVSIVTAETIKRNGYRTLSEILRNVRGFYVTHDQIYSFTGVRGVNRPGDFGGRTLIMVDGHRLNDPVYDSALTGTEGFLDVDLIERVEVIRGPGSSLYGNNAVFGVINVVTRKASSVNWGEVSGSVGSLDTYIGRFTVGHVFTNSVEFIASGTVRDKVGHERLHYPEWNDVNNGVAEDLDHDHGNHFFASMRYKSLSLSGGYNDRRKEIPNGAVGVVFNEKPSVYYDQRAFAELKYTQDIGHDWSVLGRLFYDHYHFDSYYVFDYGGVGNPADYTLNRDISLSQFVGGEAQVTKTFLEMHRLTVGGEFRKDLALDLKNFDVVSGATYTDTHNNADNFGLYGQGELKLFRPLALNAGVRFDHFRTFGDTVNPRAALIYSPFKETVFKALYGQAFRAPNAFEVGYISPTYDRNPNLKAETVRSGELVWEQGFARHYRLTSSLFYNQIQDMITKQVNSLTGNSIFRNTDSVVARGGDLEVEAQWPGGWRARASYTFSDAYDRATGDQLSNSPRHVGKFGVTIPIYGDRLLASAEVQTMSDRLTVRNTRVDAFAICNLTLFSHEVVKGVEASFSIYNLFDQRYADPVAVDYRQSAIVQDGRTFRAKLTWRF